VGVSLIPSSTLVVIDILSYHYIQKMSSR